MKVEICNLGVISRTEIDLKPLTILIGPNNMGKTWLAYVLSGIFGQRGCDEYAQAYVRGQFPGSYSRLDNAIEKVLKEGNATIDLYQFAEEYGETYFQNVADYARKNSNASRRRQKPAHSCNSDVEKTLGGRYPRNFSMNAPLSQ